MSDIFYSKYPANEIESLLDKINDFPTSITLTGYHHVIHSSELKMPEYSSANINRDTGALEYNASSSTMTVPYVTFQGGPISLISDSQQNPQYPYMFATQTFKLRDTSTYNKDFRHAPITQLAIYTLTEEDINNSSSYHSLSGKYFSAGLIVTYSTGETSFYYNMLNESMDGPLGPTYEYITRPYVDDTIRNWFDATSVSYKLYLHTYTFFFRPNASQQHREYSITKQVYLPHREYDNVSTTFNLSGLEIDKRKFLISLFNSSSPYFVQDYASSPIASSEGTYKFITETTLVNNKRYTNDAKIVVQENGQNAVEVTSMTCFISEVTIDIDFVARLNKFFTQKEE